MLSFQQKIKNRASEWPLVFPLIKKRDRYSLSFFETFYVLFAALWAARLTYALF